MFNTIRRALTRFATEEDASLIAEAVIILPVLTWWYVGSLAFFQAYEARNINLKAAYTVSDMISREDSGVDAAYIEGLQDVFAYLTLGNGTDPAIRVTLVRCTSNCDVDDGSRVLELDWSYGAGGKGALINANMSAYLDRIPLMPLGDRVILLETFVTYTPPFNVGLNVSDFQNLVVTRPRFVPVMCFEGVTCTMS
ncbi:TadE/TadG family type IV pilus assembly protein [Actibacterium sp. D379-3]